MKVDLFDVNMNPIILRGVTWLEFTPRPVEGDRITENVYNSEIVLGKTTKSRMIDARFIYEAYDFLDYKLLRNHLYSIFSPIKDLWVVDEQVPGIKWRVEVDSFEVERVNRKVAVVSLIFYSPKTYARSIGTSLDPITYDSDLWSYGMGLQMDAGTQDYIHNTPVFSIYNPSNVPVNPREDEIIIRLKSTTATGSDIKIRNNTNGNEWRYQGVFQAGDTITIDGILTKRNGLNAVGETGPLFGLIKLNEGNNDFTITGLTGEFEITFEFPFLYV